MQIRDIIPLKTRRTIVQEEQGRPNWFKRHKVWTGVIAFIVLMGVISAASGPQPTSQQQSKPTKQAESPKKEEPKFDLTTFYSAIQNGQTKEQVIQAANGKQPTSCTESEVQGLGKSELCTWSTFEGGVVVTFMSGAVSSKSKTGF